MHGQMAAAICGLQRIITDYHRNEAFAIVKYIRRCVDSWAADHFSLGFTYIDPLLTEENARKTIFTFSFSVILTFDL